ncbi:MAG: hypothetical protein A2X61_10145 [Ignavibacteria bacterium GWB2_35_12]|nr:MAG: hypothetical protein A2X63_08445 [Ignavibacteria bacterium GWA2_35_8]OGU39729.1 MAG: hypothetical protein A2X61_10145 [Ignavibacteria bacterium GWB2_35_12]OGU95302.1 MAG: hypothetical protein A2220_17160 [Ignavibacteria bacterium RIFOXYA2_FULL_35_10]OGV21381.1 MAG: hypothetical protein A2475_15130 [Ignavibacteria bacterium RIFOXYC2_FULL_35_21]
MFNNKFIAISIAILISIFSIQTAFSTSFNLNSSGEKKFEVNYKVSQPQILFLSNAPLEDIRGSVNAESISGLIALDPANIENANGNITIQVKGMETGIQKRNGHLYSKNWLDAESFPNIIFSLQKISNVKIENSGATKGRATASAIANGSITIHGKTKNVNVKVSLTYIKESEATRKRASGDFFSVSGKFDVALKDFDITGTQGLVGSKVGEVINIDLSLFFSGK